MPIKIFWDDAEKTIIRSEAVDAWTWEEFHEGLQKIIVMMKSVNHRVDIIHNHPPGTRRPPGSGMPHFQRALRLVPANIGLTIFVNTNAFGRAIISIFTRLYGKQKSAKFVMVGSLEEARKSIQRDRAQDMVKANAP